VIVSGVSVMDEVLLIFIPRLVLHLFSDTEDRLETNTKNRLYRISLSSDLFGRTLHPTSTAKFQTYGLRLSKLGDMHTRHTHQS